MASRAQSVTVTYVAWDTNANAGKTGDVGNHTLRWVKDGTSSAPTNTPTEVDAANAPGIYKLVMTTAECTCDLGVLCGKSSTAFVSIMPITVTFEQLPTAAPGTSTGLPVLDAGLRVKADVERWLNSVVNSLIAGRVDAIASVLGVDSVDATALAASATAELADRLLGRSIAGGSDGGRTVTSALRRIRNRNRIAAGTLTTYAEDDSTPDHTAAITTTAGNPVSEVDQHSPGRTFLQPLKVSVLYGDLFFPRQWADGGGVAPPTDVVIKHRGLTGAFTFFVTVLGALKWLSQQ